MNEKCWKQLEKQLCPKEKWVKDCTQNNCMCCFKKFQNVLRRKHHCRFCGNIFCSDCSDHFINGRYLGGNREKYIRECEFCYKKIQKFISEWDKMPEVYDEKQSAKDPLSPTCSQKTFTVIKSDMENNESDEAELTETSDIEEEDVEWGNEDCSLGGAKGVSETSESLNLEMQKIISDAAETICVKYNIDKRHWKNKLIELSTKGALQTKMDPLASQGAAENAMDIARKVRIKTVVTEPETAIQIIIKGIVLDKSAPTKHTKMHLSKPQVMVVQNSIDINSLASFVKYEELVKNDKAIMGRILEEIVRMNPDIIFVEQNVDVFALEYLQSREIVVISQIKRKELELIKQVAGIKQSVKKLWMLKKYKNSKVVGRCDQIYFKSIKEKQTLMFIQAEVGMRTILLGEETEEEANSLKWMIQILLRLARQLYLQKNMILADERLEKSMTGCQRTEFGRIYEFSRVAYRNLQSFLLFQELPFTKISYKPVKFAQCNKNVQDYVLRRGKGGFKQICGKVDYLTKKIYTNQDLTLGGYILLNTANLEVSRFCKRCDSSHIECYYIEGHIVTISTSKKIKSANLPRPQGHRESPSLEPDPRGLGQQHAREEEEKILPSTMNLIRELNNNDEDFTLEKLKWHLNKQKQLVVIESFIQCEICSANFSCQSLKVGKLYLSNSFHYVLYMLVHAFAQPSQDTEGSRTPGTSCRRRHTRLKKLDLDKCSHPCLVRTFEYGNVWLKISIENMPTISVDEINFWDPKAVTFMTKQERLFVESVYQQEFVEKTELLSKSISKLRALQNPSNNSNSQVARKWDENCGRVAQILSKCEFQIQQVEERAYRELREQQMPDWTLSMLAILKIDCVLRCCLIVIDYVQAIFRKKKFEDLAREVHELVIEAEDTLAEPTQNQETQGTINYSPTESMSIVRTASRDTAFAEFSDNEELKALFKSKPKRRFPKAQGAYLHFPTAFSTDPVGLLACAINSREFKKAYNEKIESEPKNSIISDVSFRMFLSNSLQTDYPLKLEADKVSAEFFGDKQEKSDAIDITAYYPQELEKLRQSENIDNELYIRSLCTCKSWDSSGGKSNSLFAKAENDLLVVKVINEKEFEEFLKFTTDYLVYVREAKVIGVNTLLAKIYGIYEIAIRGRSYKCIAMENIFFGIPPQLIEKVYDLKGSEVNRLNMPPENSSRSFTGQDTNFVVDKDGSPYILKRAEEYNRLMKKLEEDTKFLRDHQVIDYSLLVIETREYLRVGIIDYMRPYHIFERIETLYKEIRSGRDPTVIPPASYAERFLSAMRKYFIKVQ